MSDAKPNLRSALAAAQAETRGLVYKAGANHEQRYRFVGHEDVIEHVRAAMVKHGVILVPTGLRFVQELTWKTAKGDRIAWLWEQTVTVTHAHSEETMAAVVQVTTMPNDKASFVASTAADRTLLMRLMRLAGTSEENPEHDSHDDGQRREQNGGDRPGLAQAKTAADPAGSSAQAKTTDPAAVLATLHAELPMLGSPAALAEFHNHAVLEMNRARVGEEPRTAFWDAWAARCKALKCNPNAVAAAARAKQQEAA